MGRKKKWNFHKTTNATAEAPSEIGNEPNQETHQDASLGPTPTNLPIQPCVGVLDESADLLSHLPTAPTTVRIDSPSTPPNAPLHGDSSDSDAMSFQGDSDSSQGSAQRDVHNLPRYRTEPAPPSLRSLTAPNSESWRERLWRVAMTNQLLYCARGPIDYTVVKYLDAGELDVECVHCTAMLFHMEAQQYMHDGGRYSFCCGKGKITLPQLKEPPDNLMALFADTHPHSRIFKQKILQYNLQLALCGYMAKQLHYEQNFPYVYR